MNCADLKTFYTKIKIEERSHETPCWIWQGQLLKPSRYPVFGRRGLAHRVSYRHFKGEIPDGKEIDHLCSQRECVNPVHLEAVTHKENTMRGRTLTAANAAKTHCVRGHEFTQENTRIIKGGTRECRICARNRSNSSSKAHRDRNPSYQAEWMRKQRAANPEKYNEAMRRYREKNRDKINERRRAARAAAKSS